MEGVSGFQKSYSKPTEADVKCPDQFCSSILSFLESESALRGKLFPFLLQKARTELQEADFLQYEAYTVFPFHPRLPSPTDSPRERAMLL